MKKTILSGALTVALISAAAQAGAISVNGTPISQARIDAITKTMSAQAQAQGQPMDPRMQTMVRDQLITAEVLRQEAVRTGMDKKPDVRAELDNAATMTLATQLVKQYAQSHPVSDKELKAQYDKIKAATPAKKSYRAEHILVRTEAEANAIIKALQKGKPFAQLAKEKSIDPGSKANGGDLGWSSADNFVGPFGEALTHLAKGQITTKPVHTQFGWHVIKLEDVRTESFPSFEAVRGQLTQQLQGQQIEAYINSLKAKAKIQQ